MKECSAELELLALYAAAVLAHFDAVDTLCNIVALASKEEFADAKLRTEQTSLKCNAAKLALKNHRLEHNCRVGAHTVPEPTTRLEQKPSSIAIYETLPSLIH
jgi:hypothetical protein